VLFRSYRDRSPYRIHSLTVIASQTKADKPDLQRLADEIRAAVIEPVFQDEPIKPDDQTLICINPDGPFIGGGPAVHSGLTGRKNSVDNYGGYSRQSEAALSGKGPLRIDRIGAYAARYAAKNIVAAGLADECEVQLSYSIGMARPVSIQIETFGTRKIAAEKLSDRVDRLFDFRLAGIVKQFNLRYLPSLKPGGFYRQLAAYGQVGRTDIDLPWEKLDKAPLLGS